MREASSRMRLGRWTWALAWTGGGVGVVIGLAAIKAVAARPEFLPQLLNSGFLGFSALIAGMMMLRNDFREFNATQLRGVVANEELARNVGAMVTKDDQRAREQELTLNHLARQSEEILRLLRKGQHE